VKSQVTRSFLSAGRRKIVVFNQQPLYNIWEGRAKEISLQDNFPKLYLEIQTKQFSN